MKRSTLKRSKSAGAASFDERLSTEERFDSLSERNGRPMWAWRVELEVALASQAELKSLAERVEKVWVPEEPGEIDASTEKALSAKLIEIAQAAKRIVEGLPPPSSVGDVVQYRIKQAVDEAIFGRIKLFWPVLTVVGALIVGGTIWGGVHIKGLLSKTEQVASTAQKGIDDAASAIQAKKLEAQTVVDQMTSQQKVVAAAQQDAAQRLNQVELQTRTAVGGVRALIDSSAELRKNMADVRKGKTDFDAVQNTINALQTLPPATRPSVIWLTAYIYWRSAIIFAISIVILGIAAVLFVGTFLRRGDRVPRRGP